MKVCGICPALDAEGNCVRCGKDWTLIGTEPLWDTWDPDATTAYYADQVLERLKMPAGPKCASEDCDFPRWQDPSFHFPMRRWCKIHCYIRDQEINAAGGGSVIRMEDHR